MDKAKSSASDGAIFKMIEKIGNCINGFANRIERIPGKLPEIMCIAVYAIGHMLMMLVHEPWFDEALAWLIARDSSIKQVLFEAPHYEGHPGLWHLVLMPFAKLGAPYELSLTLVSLIFSGLAMTLLVWKAPFKRLVKLLIPFTYFCFYQYSVVSRPYCMMMLAMVLIAMLYKSRNDKPGRYVAAMGFLCATSAYGVVIAGGMCIVWLVEMWQAGKMVYAKNRVAGFFKYLCAKGKVWYLTGLFVYALSIIYRIMPTDKTYATIRQAENFSNSFRGILNRLLYTMFGALPDTVLTNTYSDLNVLANAGISKTELIVSGGLGILMLAAIFVYGRKKKEALTFFVPYVLLAIFSAIVYIYTFHIGIFGLLTLMWLYICMDKQMEVKKEKLASEKTNASLSMLKDVLPSLFAIFVVVAISISIMWTVTTCIIDINNEYGFGRNESEYLKKNGLDKCTVLGAWNPVFEQDKAKEGYDEFDVAFSYTTVCVAPYLEDAILLNHMDELGLDYASIHKTNDSKENAEIIEKIKSKGMPEVLLCLPDLAVFFDNQDVNITDYMKVYQNRFGTAWKGMKGLGSASVYVRRDIAEEKGLTEIKIKKEG